MRGALEALIKRGTILDAAADLKYEKLLQQVVQCATGTRHNPIIATRTVCWID